MEPMKRKHETENCDFSWKFIKLKHDDRLEDFLVWCKNNNLLINSKVTVSRQGSCAQYGLVATDDINEGECLLDIPRSMLLTTQTSAISSLLQKEKSCLESKSGWVPLLVALMYEYTTPSSHWTPYIHLVPDYTQLYLPMFWPKEDLLTHLQGTGVPECVDRDLNNIKQEFSDIVLPFLHKHRDVFQSDCYDLDLYMKMVAFIMSYSFTEPLEDEDEDDDEEGIKVKPSPMMVPTADILNHVTDNNAHLDFGTESLRMTATKSIKKGDEVYNTYGPLSNQELLHMYGFTETYPLNTHDTVEIPMSLVNDVLVQDLDSSMKELLEEKWCHLKSKEVLTDDFMYLLGPDGFITDWEMYETLKVLSMDKATFQQVNAQEELSDTEGEDAMSYDDIEKLPDSWKLILERIVIACMKKYPRSLDDEQHLLTGVVWSTLPRWQQYCAHLRLSHLSILHELSKKVRQGQCQTSPVDMES